MWAWSRKPAECPLAPCCANFLHRTLGPPVALSDPEYNRVHKRERVSEHQALDLSIRASAPVFADEKCPADFDFASLGITPVVSAGTDDRAC